MQFCIGFLESYMMKRKCWCKADTNPSEEEVRGTRVLMGGRGAMLGKPPRKKVLFKRNSWTAAPSGKVFHYWSSYLCSATAGAASGLGEGIGSLVHSWAGGCSRCSQPSPAGHIQSRLDSRKSSQHWEKYSPPRLGKIQASRSSWLLNWKFLKGWKL